MIAEQTTAEQIAADARGAGKIAAYELGVRYPGIPGVPREPFAVMLDEHGYSASAARVRGIDSTLALSRAVQAHAAWLLRGPASGNVSYKVAELAAAGDHTRSWGIEQVETVPGERAPRRLAGARVFASPLGIFAAGPVDETDPSRETAADPTCFQIATALAQQAHWILLNVDKGEISRTLMGIFADGAYPWLSKGTYLAPAGRPVTDKIVALANAVRDRFYDESKRAGIRTTVVEILESNRSAISDSLIDAFEARVSALAAKVKDHCSRSNVRAGTLREGLDEARAVVADMGPFAALLGQFQARIAEVAKVAEGAYQGLIAGQTINLPEWYEQIADPSDDGEGGAPLPAPPAPVASEPAPETSRGSVPPPPPVAPSGDADLAVFDL